MSDIHERHSAATFSSESKTTSRWVTAAWVVDPRHRRAYAANPSGALELALADLTVGVTEIRVPIPDIFAELDELEAGS